MSTRRLGNHKVASAKAQVRQLKNVHIGLDERIASTDAAIRAAKGHECRGVGGPHDDVLDVLATDDELTTRLCKVGHIKPSCFEQLDRPREQRALRHGDAQGPRRVRAALEGRLDAVERKREAGSASGLAIAFKHLVVATAGTQLSTQPGQIRLKHHACVVTERPHDREVDGDLPLETGSLRAGKKLGHLIKAAFLRTSARLDKGVGRLDGLRTAANARQAQQRVGNHGSKLLGRLIHELGQTDEIAALAKPTRPLAPLVGHSRTCKQHVERPGTSHGDDIALQAGSLKGARHEQQRLGVGLKAVDPDELNTKLGELARLTGKRIALAHDGRVVPQAQRALTAAQARGNHASDGQRHVGAQHEQRAIGIEEAKRHIACSIAILEQVAHFKQGRLNREISGLGKACAYRRAYLFAPKCLFRKHVSESARGGCGSRGTHRFLLGKLCYNCNRKLFPKAEYD